MSFGYLVFALVLCASFVIGLERRNSDSSPYERVASSLLGRGKHLEKRPASNLQPWNRVRRANRRRSEYGAGRSGGERGTIRLIALDYPVNGYLKGTSSADQLCRDAAFSQARLNGSMWRAVIATRVRSLQSLLIYETERQSAKIVNRKGELLFNSWLDFLSGRVGESNPILSFNGTKIEDKNIDYAWFGYLENTNGNGQVTAPALHPYCGSWMFSNKGTGPALYLAGFKKSRSVEANVKNQACGNKAVLLCVEAKVASNVIFSPFGRATVRKGKKVAKGRNKPAPSQSNAAKNRRRP